MGIPQRIAATPSYIPKDLKDAAPGHRFQLYLEHWQGQSGSPFEPFKKSRPQGKDERITFERECAGILKDLCPLPASSLETLKGIRTRQQALIGHYGSSGYRISTTSTAPFATGLGNEHPIENGFAFLTPYGLPYLAGSGVKGILRRAMQELRDEAEAGFTDPAIDALFGPEIVAQPTDAKRGALDFWDVYPNPAGGRLAVEIMTPHYAKYYQGKEAPHDSGSPNPVSFLAVPAKSQFDFHVVCQPLRLPEALQGSWRGLLDRAFQHAFEWVGFGAKTSVGYGAMKSATAPSAVAANNAASLAGAPASAAAESWPSARLKFNSKNGTLTAEADGNTANAFAPQAQALLLSLPENLQAKIRQNQCFAKFSVTVAGNALLSVKP